MKTRIKNRSRRPERLRRSGLIAMTAAILLLMMMPCALAEPINCDIQNQPCSQNLSGVTMTLDITPRPVKAMADLTFRVTLPHDLKGKTPFIDLGMPGMNMGKNRVPLARIEKGVYEGKGVIVRCPSGKTVWKALVTAPGTGKAGFIFDVVY